MTDMRGKRASRADDERILTMLAMRDAGVPYAEISARLGVSVQTVRNTVSRVRIEYEASEAAR